MEGNTRLSSSRSRSRTRKGTMKHRSSDSREQQHRTRKMLKALDGVEKKKTVRKEPQMEATKAEEQEEERPKLNSTVVNVDSVRDKEGDDEAEESLGLLEWERPEEGLKKRNLGLCEWLLTGMALVIIFLSFPLSIWLCVTIVREHERAIIFRLGHLLEGKPRGPGLLFYIPFLDVCQKVDIRLKMLKIVPHTVVTKDLVTTELSAVCYYRMENVSLCFTALSGISNMLQGMFQVTERDVLAHYTFSQILLDRKEVTKEIQVALDAVTSQWGIKVERAEIEDIHLPAELQHSLAAEAEAKRLAQIKIIAAEGERAACEALKASVESLSGSPAAIQLRLLQLLQTLRTEHPTLVLNLPSELLALPAHTSASPEPVSHSLTVENPTEKSHRDSPMM
ncbi:podocin-like [Scleropages formosus]|nr:podocin [Scleropages formosus]KPP66765.1 podocin-like [Scleropages formosus]